MKTVVHNHTKKTVVLVGFSNVLFEKIKPRGKSEIDLDPAGTYREYWFKVNSSSKTNAFFVEDCKEWRSIEIRPRKDDPTKFEWKGMKLRQGFERDALLAALKDASGSIEALASFSVELQKDEKRVVIYRAQCANLVQFCSERVQKIRKIFSLLTENQMSRLMKSRKLPQLAVSLDNLRRDLLSAQKLLKGCGQKECRRAALVLSLPPPDPQNLEKYSGSKFAHVIRELGWSFDMLQFALGEAGTTNFKWDDGRDRYVLHGSQAENVLAIDEMESLEGDRDREILDHEELISDLKNGSLLKDSFSISLAGWLWYNFLIALAGWFWYDFFISLGRWLWYTFPLWNFAATIQKWCLARWLWYVTFPLWNFAATIQKWCLAGCSWYNSSHVKFAATIQIRCQNQNFETDDLDLRKKKRIGKGGYKKVHKGKWLGLEVAIATFPLQMSEELLKGFKREAGFMVTLHHPNVVDFYGRATQKDQRTAFLVMELMEEDLGHLIDKIMENRARPSGFRGLFSLFQDSGGPFSLSVTVDILMQIVEAMIHSHKHQVMHRDLKPSNCLVSRKSPPRPDMDVHYTVKVIDFGISKLWDTKANKHTRQQGTIQFMAPEVWAPGGQYTYSADVFSFGMLCFQVITGSDPCSSPPFDPYMHVDRRYELLSSGYPPTIPADCPASLSILMRKCWATIPTNRPTFKAIWKDLWDYRLLLEAKYVPKPPSS